MIDRLESPFPFIYRSRSGILLPTHPPAAERIIITIREADSARPTYNIPTRIARRWILFRKIGIYVEESRGIPGVAWRKTPVSGRPRSADRNCRSSRCIYRYRPTRDLSFPTSSSPRRSLKKRRRSAPPQVRNKAAVRARNADKPPIRSAHQKRDLPGDALKKMYSSRERDGLRSIKKCKDEFVGKLVS